MAGNVNSQLSISNPVRKRRRGFALIELVMVCIIVGLMALIVMPKIRIDNSQVDTAARTINTSMMVAQREAVARQQNVLVMFDTAHHVVRTVWDANNNGSFDTGEKTRPFLLPERVMIGRPSSVPKLGGAGEVSLPGLTTSGGPLFIMMRGGSVDRSAVLYFTTRASMSGGQYSDVRAMSISRATGRPVWYKWGGGAWRRG
ncbi:MAG: prepilin-type N-terminal cleavage/methylation domain-containing protein [Gemmatimonadaceae bacterium]